MRLHALIALSGAAALALAAPIQAQKYKGGEPFAEMKPGPERTEELLNSNPGCQRHTASYDNIAQELTAVTRNAACRNYVPLDQSCRPPMVWNLRYTRPLPTPLWADYAPATFTVGRQNVMIAQARAAAAAIAVPPGTRLYRLTYRTANVGTGFHPTQRVLGEAHYGACGLPHAIP